MRQIYRLKRDQGKADTSQNRERVLVLADLSLHGYLQFLQSSRPYAIPEVGCFLKVGSKEILFDLVWIKSQRDMVTKANRPSQEIEGREVKEFGEALEMMNR